MSLASSMFQGISLGQRQGQSLTRIAMALQEREAERQRMEQERAAAEQQMAAEDVRWETLASQPGNVGIDPQVLRAAGAPYAVGRMRAYDQEQAAQKRSEREKELVLGFIERKRSTIRNALDTGDITLEDAKARYRELDEQEAAAETGTSPGTWSYSVRTPPRAEEPELDPLTQIEVDALTAQYKHFDKESRTAKKRSERTAAANAAAEVLAALREKLAPPEPWGPDQVNSAFPGAGAQAPASQAPGAAGMGGMGGGAAPGGAGAAPVTGPDRITSVQDRAQMGQPGGQMDVSRLDPEVIEAAIDQAVMELQHMDFATAAEKEDAIDARAREIIQQGGF